MRKAIMQFWAGVALGLAVFTIATGLSPAQAAEPPSSLQPFRQFAAGEGHGYALEYVARDKKQFVAWLRSGKKRVPCEVFVRQVAEAHPGFPGEGCEGAAHEIESNPEYDVVACQDGMLGKLAVTSEDGKAFGWWSRRCYQGEMVLVRKVGDQVEDLASTTCGNPVLSTTSPARNATVAATTAPAVTSVMAGSCPYGYKLVANVWSLEKVGQVSPVLRRTAEGLIAEAEMSDSKNAKDHEAYKPGRFSRSLGGQLRRDVRERASLAFSIRVVLLNPVTGAMEQDLGAALRVTDGVGNITLTKEQTQKVIETVWPNHLDSPAVSGGARLLRLYPPEWKDECTMNIHGAVRKVPS